MEYWGEANATWLAGFLEMPHGAPTQDVFLRVFGALAPEAFSAVFRAWVALLQLRMEIQGKHIAIDGKTSRRSFDSGGGKKVIHTLSAWMNDAYTAGSPPPEVNVFLRDQVGCSKKTPDGLYYFDSDDTPGIVYVPYTWGTKLDAGPHERVTLRRHGAVLDYGSRVSLWDTRSLKPALEIECYDCCWNLETRKLEQRLPAIKANDGLLVSAGENPGAADLGAATQGDPPDVAGRNGRRSRRWGR